jgi:hypothetical protein
MFRTRGVILKFRILIHKRCIFYLYYIIILQCAVQKNIKFYTALFVCNNYTAFFVYNYTSCFDYIKN